MDHIYNFGYDLHRAMQRRSTRIEDGREPLATVALPKFSWARPKQVSETMDDSNHALIPNMHTPTLVRTLFDLVHAERNLT